MKVELFAFRKHHLTADKRSFYLRIDLNDLTILTQPLPFACVQSLLSRHVVRHDS
jgi:hypothetical protein